MTRSSGGKCGYERRLKELTLNPRPYEWSNFSPAVPWSLSAITTYTRSFSYWSIAYIEPPLEPALPPLDLLHSPRVSEMAIKSMGTNEIKLLCGSEEQMIFLWLITHCKRSCAEHIASESISLPWLVSSGWDSENEMAGMMFVWGGAIW